MAIGSGISFSVSGVLQALSNISTTVVGTLENTAASLVGPWRPPQWAGPAQTTITVPGNSAGIGSTADLGVLNGGAGSLATTDANAALGGIPTFSATTGRTATPDIIYVFDGVLQLEHTQEVVVTEHPVENSENITDHAFVKAARVSLDVLMSDAMQSYILGQWTGSNSKSVSAYQTILGLQLARKPLTLTTRLNTYTNMLITSIHTPDDYKTKFGLRATITFQQIFNGITSTALASARPQTTGSTGVGTVPTTPLPGVVGSNYFVEPPPVGTPIVSGAGDFSSNPFSGS